MGFGFDAAYRHLHLPALDADIYQIAKNCRTSVEMIEKYYAAHIKTSLDAAAINVMRPKRKKQPKEVRAARAASSAAS